MTRSLPRKSASVRGCPVWSTSVNGPPTGSRFHIKASMSSAAVRSAAVACPTQLSTEPSPSAATLRRKPLLSFIVAPRSLLRSGAEREPAAGRRNEELVRHLLPHGLNEIVTAAMHRDDHI